MITAKTWLLLLAGPALFLVAFVGIAVFLGSRGVEPTQIAARIPLLMPQILLGVLLCLGVLVFFLVQLDAVWATSHTTKTISDVAIGMAAGGLLALSYIYWIAPFLESIQRAIGDYVPAGSVLPTVSGSIGVFFIANVLLAPLVEETLYRGYAIPLLASHFGTTWAVGITCLLFGLLHWPGGFWYMLLTGGVVGFAFAGLFLWRDGILAPFAAHLTLNAIEFIYAGHMQQAAQA
jgi:membrane protease YdiL (CAAX protease family)